MVSFDGQALDAALAAERVGELLVFVSALAAPFALRWFADWRGRRRGRPVSKRTRNSWTVVGMVYAYLAMLGTYCRGGVYVGEEPRKRFAIEAAAPVVDALSRYRGARGAYPDSLAQLAPAFLPARVATGALPAREDFPGGLEYTPGRGGYTLTFHYVGPGANTCTYTPASTRWSCSGIL